MGIVKQYASLSEANCQAMKANTSLTKLTYPLILTESCFEIFFNSIPSHLKEISTLVLLICDNKRNTHCFSQVYPNRPSRCDERGLYRTTAARALLHNTYNALNGGQFMFSAFI